MQIRDVTIVGAGPAGLAAAIAAKQAGLDYSIIEKGVLVNSIYKFPVNMVFFTTPELLEIGGLPLVSPFEKPTRLEALRYYRRVVDTYELAIDFGEQVVDVKPGSTHGRSSEAAQGRLRCRDALGQRRAADPPQPQRDLRYRLFRSSELSSACRARTCRTCRTTTTSRTASTGRTWSSSAAATRRPKRRSSSTARARTSRSCIAIRS